MRVGGQPAALGQFAAEILQVPFVEPPFQERPGIVTRRGVALEINEVAQLSVVAAAKEVVVPDLIQGGRGGVAGDMAAQAVGDLVAIDHHGHGIPAADALDATFDRRVAGILRLLFRRNGVAVGCLSERRRREPRLAQGQDQVLEEPRGLFRSLTTQFPDQHALQVVHPLGLIVGGSSRSVLGVGGQGGRQGSVSGGVHKQDLARRKSTPKRGRSILAIPSRSNEIPGSHSCPASHSNAQSPTIWKETF
jgi:hypothetical protein